MDDISKSVILGFPSFVGLVYCIWIQKQHIDRLIQLLERCYADCGQSENGKQITESGKK